MDLLASSLDWLRSVDRNALPPVLDAWALPVLREVGFAAARRLSKEGRELVDLQLAVLRRVAPEMDRAGVASFRAVLLELVRDRPDLARACEEWLGDQLDAEAADSDWRRFHRAWLAVLALGEVDDLAPALLAATTPRT